MHSLRHHQGTSAMTEHVYKKIEITGTSTVSMEEAVRNAVARAAKTVQNMRRFEVVADARHDRRRRRLSVAGDGKNWVYPQRLIVLLLMPQAESHATSTERKRVAEPPTGPALSSDGLDRGCQRDGRWPNDPRCVHEACHSLALRARCQPGWTAVAQRDGRWAQRPAMRT